MINNPGNNTEDLRSVAHASVAELQELKSKILKIIASKIKNLEGGVTGVGKSDNLKALENFDGIKKKLEGETIPKAETLSHAVELLFGPKAAAKVTLGAMGSAGQAVSGEDK